MQGISLLLQDPSLVKYVLQVRFLLSRVVHPAQRAQQVPLVWMALQSVTCVRQVTQVSHCHPRPVSLLLAQSAKLELQVLLVRKLAHCAVRDITVARQVARRVRLVKLGTIAVSPVWSLVQLVQLVHIAQRQVANAQRVLQALMRQLVPLHVICALQVIMELRRAPHKLSALHAILASLPLPQAQSNVLYALLVTLLPLRHLLSALHV